MRHIPSQSHPLHDELITARKKGVSWNDFSTSPQGDALRQAKAIEQNGLCAYCECKLTGDDGNLPKGIAHIDHFHRRNNHPEQTFNWDNLFLSCKKDSHCGLYKDYKRMHTEDIIHPRSEQPQEYITFVSDSSFGVYARPLPKNNRARAEYTIKAFNLNAPELVAQRYQSLIENRIQIDNLTEEIECAIEYELWEEQAELISKAIKLLQDFSTLPYASTIMAYAKERWTDYMDISQ